MEARLSLAGCTGRDELDARVRNFLRATLEDDLRRERTDALVSEAAVDIDELDARQQARRVLATEQADAALVRIHHIIDAEQEERAARGLVGAVVAFFEKRRDLWNEVVRRIGTCRDSQFVVQEVVAVLREELRRMAETRALLKKQK